MFQRSSNPIVPYRRAGSSVAQYTYSADQAEGPQRRVNLDRRQDESSLSQPTTEPTSVVVPSVSVSVEISNSEDVSTPESVSTATTSSADFPTSPSTSETEPPPPVTTSQPPEPPSSSVDSYTPLPPSSSYFSSFLWSDSSSDTPPPPPSTSSSSQISPPASTQTPPPPSLTYTPPPPSDLSPSPTFTSSYVPPYDSNSRSMSSPSPTSSYIVTDTPPSSSSSSPDGGADGTVTPPTPPPSSETSSSIMSTPPPTSPTISEPTISISTSISISIPTSSSSMDGNADDTSSSSTVVVSPTDPPPSSTVSSPSSSSTPPSSSSSSSSSASNPDGGGDDISSTISGSTPPPSSSSSSSPGSSSSSYSSSGQDHTVNEEPTVTPTSRREDEPSPTVEPVSTVPTPVSFTTTNSEGDTIITIPTQFTTVVVSTVPGGTFTTITEVVANPPGSLNPGGNDSASASAFFKNKGAVAGVFIAAALALCAIVLFALFAVRRRRTKLRNDRDAEIAAGLAAAAATNNRFTDDDDHPVVMRSVPSALRGRSPWLDEEDEDRLMYDAAIASNAPVMYSNVNNNVMRHSLNQQMPISREGYYPTSPVPYALARSTESSPSPKKEPGALPGGSGLDPTTSSNPVPRSSSGLSSAYGGMVGFFGGRKSVSPVPTTNAGHAPPTSASHAPSSYYNHRPPPSFAHESGSGSGSGGTSVPSLPTAVPGQGSVSGGFGARRSSPNASAHDSLSGSRKDSPSPAPGLDGMYPPEYELYAGSGDERVASAGGRYSVVDPDVGYAYEPEPMQHTHAITAGLPFVQGFDYNSSSNLHQSNTGPFVSHSNVGHQSSNQQHVPNIRFQDEDEVRSPLSGDLGVRGRVQSTGSTVSRSLYSQEGSGEWEEHGRDAPREDPRLDPLMRMRGGLVSQLSMGPRDHEDYMRRVQAQPLTSPSTASHSHSLSRSHSTH